jgi:hypothetical protein
MSSAAEVIEQLAWTARKTLTNSASKHNVDARFRLRAGEWNGRSVTLSTELWDSADGNDQVRIAQMSGVDVASVTLLTIPTNAAGSAILAMDVVAFGGRVSTALFDLCPARPLLDAPTQGALAGVHSRWSKRPAPEGVPFSPFVVATDDADREALLGVFTELLGVWRAERRVTGARSMDEVARFLAALGRVKKQLKALSSLFGGDWVAEYFDQVFLSTPRPS